MRDFAAKTADRAGTREARAADRSFSSILMSSRKALVLEGLRARFPIREVSGSGCVVVGVSPREGKSEMEAGILTRNQRVPMAGILIVTRVRLELDLRDCVI